MAAGREPLLIPPPCVCQIYQLWSCQGLGTCLWLLKAQLWFTVWFLAGSICFGCRDTPACSQHCHAKSPFCPHSYSQADLGGREWIWAAESATGHKGKPCDVHGGWFVERVLIKSAESLIWQKWRSSCSIGQEGRVWMELGFQSPTEGKWPTELAGVFLKAVLLLLSHSEGLLCRWYCFCWGL